MCWLTHASCKLLLRTFKEHLWEEKGRWLESDFFPLCPSAVSSKLHLLCPSSQGSHPQSPCSSLLWDRLEAKVSSRLAANLGHLGNELGGCSEGSKCTHTHTYTHTGTHLFGFSWYIYTSTRKNKHRPWRGELINLISPLPRGSFQLMLQRLSFKWRMGAWGSSSGLQGQKVSRSRVQNVCVEAKNTP